jgi:uncharacterized membrane protein YoaK (UPF0700 family)
MHVLNAHGCAGVTMDNRGHKAHHSVYMLAIACGMQNAMTTRYSGAVLRTTHLTGMVTDVGLLIGHMARSDRDFHDLWKLTLFLPIIFCESTHCSNSSTYREHLVHALQ